MKLKNLMVVIAGAILIAVPLSRFMGQQLAQVHIAKLRLVWGALEELNPKDRALIAGLAVTCQLERNEVVTAADTLSCLRTDLDEEKPMLPKSMGREDARRRLEKLIRDRV
ncbi:hypothetical protein [Nitrogeniibacter aestuarii]|uniref:hypothetical protein n=1 Tax=Nitrogeniibacter aestuarii TaxID=2815343 RepID=UPI001E6204F6|nr:hypothetical protein [Nitrogeniibacter aestuarii]